MSAQIIIMQAWRMTHSDKAVRLRLAYDPLWMWPVRVWLALWAVPCARWIGERIFREVKRRSVDG